MGHAEMLLAVAGLSGLTVDERVRELASGDWSGFSPAERAALFLARRVTLRPHAVSQEQSEQLQRLWGTTRALDICWHLSWCNFMTRVADAFQIPLESVNVFAAS